MLAADHPRQRLNGGAGLLSPLAPNRFGYRRIAVGGSLEYLLSRISHLTIRGVSIASAGERLGVKVADLPKLPGQELERAGAEIITAAGNVLFAGLRRRFEAWFGVASARDEARAAEIEADFAHSGKLKRIRASIEERRDQELREVAHRRHLQLLESALSDTSQNDLLPDGGHLPLVSTALSPMESREFLKRGIGRSFDEITTEQRRVEFTALDALELVEADPESNNPREIDDDWLMNFFKYASEVSEVRVRQILLIAPSPMRLSSLGPSFLLVHWTRYDSLRRRVLIFLRTWRAIFRCLVQCHDIISLTTKIFVS
jgi:hypothetical protein